MSYSKIDPEFKARWVSALRSGEYTQTTGCLRKIDQNEATLGFCCLGVGLDLVDPTAWKGLDPELAEEWAEDGRDDGWYDGPPMIHEAEVGWGYYGSDDTALPFINKDPETGSMLATMNDQSKLSFEQIADWIEEEL